MNTTQLPVDVAEIQASLARVALSLDSFLLNGLQYGVLWRVTDGFLQKVVTTLLSDLATLEEQARNVRETSPVKVAEGLAALRAGCQHLVDLVTELSSFRTLPLEQVLSKVSRIPLLRETCVQQVQELDACLQTPKPFFASRPAHTTAAMNDFLANLKGVFAQAWNA